MCWTSQAHLVAKQSQEDEERERMREQQQAGQDGEPMAERQEEGGENEVEGVGVAAQEVAYGVDEGVEVAIEGEDGEIVGEDQLVRLREEFEERLEDVVARYEVPRSPSPPPALECVTLPSSHIAQVNSVLLVGGEGAVCATGSRDWNVKLWDLQGESGGRLLHTLGGQGDFSTHRAWVWCLASQGPLLVSGGFDSTVRLWDLQASGATKGLIRTGAAVLCLSCQTDVLLAGTFDKRISMYDIRGEMV